MKPSNKNSGYELIHSYLTALDNSPGVYRMLDEQNRVLYVGKARNLRNRVSSYSRPSPSHSSRIARMISETASMMFLTTSTETEALLLEQNLIKQLKPRYNVLLRDDKSFPNILVSKEHSFPQLKKHRGNKKEKGSYFGPFASASAVNRTLNQLQKVFMLRNCSDSIFSNRTRPCLQYQIKRCSAPCVGRISEQEYFKSVKDAQNFLSGKTTNIQENLAKEMKRASDQMEFEKAASIRDRIGALTQVQTRQGINPRSVKEADVIALHVDKGHACVQVFFIRAHQNWGNSDFYPKISDDMSNAEIMEGFIGQFYNSKEPARLLILSHEPENSDLITDLLSERLSRKVEVSVPQRGERLELVSGALRNAVGSLNRKMAETATQTKLLKDLAKVFGLSSTPRRIEVFDNSHIQGAHAVGAMVVVGPDGFMKNQYRKFNFKNENLVPGDDFGMMREVLERRIRRLSKEDPDRGLGMWPDLIIIDGGAGQVSAVGKVLADLGIVDVAMVGVAKGVDRNHGKEEFYMLNRPAFASGKNDPVLYFIQRMRDEAHNFVIGTHRSKRSKTISANPLDDIPGVGASRKRALLDHFGSSKRIKSAHLSDLKSVDGISSGLAERIYNHFNDT